MILVGKVYGYCRVAFKSEEDMAQQRKMIEDCCRENGMEVDEFFCDNGVSGLRFDRRGLQSMLDVLQDGDIVITKDIARISREISQCMSIVGSIYKAGALIKLIN